jgi:hypothetical protein
MIIVGYCHKFVLACQELQALRQVQNKTAIFLKIWSEQETSQEKHQRILSTTKNGKLWFGERCLEER